MEERRLREEALKYQARAQSNASTSASPDAAPAEQKEVADFQNAREAVEKLWAEKRAEANEAQKRANDKVSSGCLYINQHQAMVDNCL